MQLKICGIGHFRADQADALLKDVGDEADAAGEAVETRDDDLRVFSLSERDGFLKFAPGIISSRLNVTKFTDQSAGVSQLI